MKNEQCMDKIDHTKVKKELHRILLRDDQTKPERKERKVRFILQ